MSGRTKRGRDYTPLFRFLLSRVGRPWIEVLAEVKPRLDTVEPVFWVVAKTASDAQDIVRVGVSSYFSGMFVDSNGTLQLTRPELNPEDMVPTCACCTHTLNGRRFGKQYLQRPASQGEA